MIATAPMQRTASGKEAALVEFYRQLSLDGYTVTELADFAKIGRTTLTLMFNGTRTGRQSWKHVIPLLSNEALFRLKQCSAWNHYAEAAAKEFAL